MASTFKKLLDNIGPGLLFASMAIGTSHLVMSTKAGAQYGAIMILPIIIANVLKYPFFEFGVRYTNATNKTLIEGYLSRGKGYLWFYAIITLVSTFTILAALYIVTSGLFINLFNISEISIPIIALCLFSLISLLLIIGKYSFLEKSLKYVITILLFAVLITTVLVIFKGQVVQVQNFKTPPIFNEAGILFLIGLMGWMPTTVEASSWISLWSKEKWITQGNKPSLKESLREFNIGYLITSILALFFLIIGWLTLYGTNTILSNSSVTFAHQVVTLFTIHIGEWAYIFISVAAFATMFSTCMTAHDAIARVSVDILQLLHPKIKKQNSKKLFTIGVLILALLNFIVIASFGANMAQLVALATFVSFVVAPIIGFMNLKNVLSPELNKNQKPKSGLQILSYLGIIFLSLFSVYYFWIVIF
ncbi:divalent metal cation transporter [uncultured Maribacter sp.]|uniref:NRAMP family divalent metal transporter n=1 Tax=uncultured Maribacter sp. TaxID=431308 RepID=UPI0034309D2A